MDIIDVIRDDILMSLEMTSNQNTMEGIRALPLISRLALCFYAAGSFQKASDSLYSMTTSAAHNAIHYVARAIVRRKGNYILFPRREKLARAKRECFGIEHFPHSVIQCTYEVVSEYPLPRKRLDKEQNRLIFGTPGVLVEHV